MLYFFKKIIIIFKILNKKKEIFINMKYLITESQIDNFVYQYLEDVVDPNREGLITYHPFEYHDDGEEYEDVNRIGVYANENEETLFFWYAKEYWGGSEYAKKYKKNCPLVEISDRDLITNLNSHFRDKWYIGFKKWFADKTDLPVNKVMCEIR